MRVILNGLPTLKPKTGIGHHIANLTEALVRLYPDDQFTLYPGEQLGSLVRRFNRSSSASPSVSNESDPAKPNRPSLLKRTLGLVKPAAKRASEWHFRAYGRAMGFDLYHEPNHVPFRSHLPTILTVHDLSAVRYPQWHPADRVKMYENRFREGLKQAATFITGSYSIRDEISREFAIPAESITVVYHGVSADFRPRRDNELSRIRERYQLPGNFLLSVGTIEPRKNIGMLMRAFAELPSAVRESCPLLLVGPWGWRAEADRAYYEKEGRGKGIRHLGYVPEGDLPLLYAAATCLVYPTFYEGFGLPPIEMMACGGAVLASTAGSVMEACGRCAAFLDPSDPVVWREAMGRVATDRAYLAELQSGVLEHARTFTWDRAARETMSVYQRVLNSD